MENLITIGVITNAHGIKGAVKIKSFTENPDDIFAYTPVCDDQGSVLDITKIGVAKGLYMAQVSGCNSRDEAQQLKGTSICVSRDQLPALNGDEYYQNDLVGCTVLDGQKTQIGTVKAMHNYGAGDVIEVHFDATNDSELFLFASDIGDIDIDNRTVVLHVPTYVDVQDEHEMNKAKLQKDT